MAMAVAKSEEFELVAVLVVSAQREAQRVPVPQRVRSEEQSKNLSA